MKSIVFFAILKLLHYHDYEKAELIAPIIESESARFDVDPLLVVAVIDHESHFKIDSISHDRKDYGLMQIRRCASDRCRRFSKKQMLNPITNIHYGVWYLRDRINNCKSMRSAIGSYNAGHCKVNNYGYQVYKEYKNLVKEFRPEFTITP